MNRTKENIEQRKSISPQRWRVLFRLMSKKDIYELFQYAKNSKSRNFEEILEMEIWIRENQIQNQKLFKINWAIQNVNTEEYLSKSNGRVLSDFEALDSIARELVFKKMWICGTELGGNYRPIVEVLQNFSP